MEKFLNLYKNDADAARAAKVSPQYISFIRSGKRGMTKKVAMAIHRDHRIPLWDLLPDDYPKNIFYSHKKWL